MNLPNMIIPKQFPNDQVVNAMKMLQRRAVEQARSVGMKACYCHGCRLKDSFTGYVNPEGKLRIGLHFNMGIHTASVWGLLTPYTGEFEMLHF